MTIKTNPYKAVSFVESAVEKALEAAGSLIADCKYDGVRLNLLVNEHPDTGNGSASFLSRVSKEIPALAHLNELSERWGKFLADDEQPFKAGLMIDGEVMVKGVDFNTSSGLLRTAHLKEKNMKFDTRGLIDWDKKTFGTKSPFQLAPARLKVVVYAVVPMDVVESGKEYDRMNCLMQHDACVQVALLERHFPEIEWCIAESHDVFSMEDLYKLYENVRELGHEGLVVKDPLGNYKRGKKSGWFKLKPECEADGKIVGNVWGTEGLSNEGKVIGFEVLLESGRVVNACNISRALMDEFTANVKTNTDYYMGYQVEINYMEETLDGSLRHPTFSKFRGTEADPLTKI